MKRLVTLCCLLSLASNLWAKDLDLGEGDNSSLTPAQEQKMGDAYIKEILASGLVLTDPLVNDYIDQLGKRLAHAAHTRKPIRFFVLNVSAINAFTGPDGYIGINSGLITTVQKEDELAAVLAHEVAHVTQSHLARAMDEAKQMQIPTIAAAIAAAALGVKSPQMATGALAMAQAGYSQNAINFTRAHEEEADRIGFKILTQAQFNPLAMAQAFKRLAQQQQLYPALAPQVLQTHPYNQKRIADALNRVKKINAGNYSDPLNFHLMQARIKVLTTEHPDHLAREFLQLPNTNSNDHIANQYGNALVQFQLRNYAQAQHLLQPLVENHPQEPLFISLAAQLHMANHQPQAAIDLLEKNIQAQPHYLPLQLQMAETLIDAKKFPQAIALLRHEIVYHRQRGEFYALLGKAYAANHNLARAYYTQAEFSLLIQDKATALHQLRIAAHSKPIDSDLQEMIAAKILEIKNGTPTGILN